jgi:hypothetical protein
MVPSPSKDPGKQWEEYRRQILHELELHHEQIRDLFKRVNQDRVDIAVLKEKAGIIGLIGGAIPAAVVLLVWLVKGTGGGGT